MPFLLCTATAKRTGKRCCQPRRAGSERCPWHPDTSNDLYVDTGPAVDERRARTPQRAH